MCVEEKARRQECAAVSTREAEEALRFSEVAHEATQGLREALASARLNSELAPEQAAAAAEEVSAAATNAAARSPPVLENTIVSLRAEVETLLDAGRLRERAAERKALL